MAADQETMIRIARSQGQGSGVFLAKSLIDALTADAGLVAVNAARSEAALAHVDFVLRSADNAGFEVVRAVLDGAGEIVAAELLRTWQAPRESLDGPDNILKTLENGRGVARIAQVAADGGDAAGLAVTMRSGACIVIALTDSATVPPTGHG